MKTNLSQILSEKFRFDSFRLGQKEAIEAALSGRDSLVMLPTGTGKSICYQMPAYLQKGLTVIVSPLLSLMQDQVSSVKRRGEKRVASLTSEHHPSLQTRILSQLSQIRYLFLSPEMLSRRDVIQSLQRQQINLLAIDEAHCISEWGLDFRPDYLALGYLREKLGSPVTMALTATATERTRREIMTTLRMNGQETEQIVYPLDRPEIKWHVEMCQSQDKDEKLLDFVKQIDSPMIVYFMSKKECERLAAFLDENTQLQVAFYHSGVQSEDKVKIQERFKQGHIDLICATSAFGMGIDKDNIRAIIHYHLPASPEMYLQEVGRACRDGKDGLAILLYSPGDEQFQAFVQQESIPDAPLVHWVYQQDKDYSFAEDSQVQLIARYKQVGISEQKTWEMLQKRQYIKKVQLAALLNYIQTDGCLRQTLLDYFDESKQTSEGLCCSHCQPDLCETVIESMVKTPHKEEVEQKYLPWQEKIKKLYRLDATVEG